MKLIKKPYTVAALSVFLIGFSAFYIFSLYPFSNLTVAWCDMKQQVLPLMIEFRDILLGKGNLFLNMQNAGGMSLWGVFLFFLSSPFSFLVVFIEPSELYLFINVIILMKMAVCAVCASVFFMNVYKNLTLLQNAALSVMYAFSGYTMLYYQNIVWLDAMYLFPLVMLGIYRIFKSNKPYLFVFSFSALIAVHFYLTYMASIFIIIFATVYTSICFGKVKREKALHQIALSAVFSFMLTAVCWIPMLFEYLDSARGVSVIRSLKSSGIFTHYSTTLITIICTGMVFSALALVLFSGKFRENQFSALIISFAFVAVPLVFDPVNKMWHTGSYQAFPSRYGFINVFIGLVIAARLIAQLNTENKLKKENNISYAVPLLAFALAVWGNYLISNRKESLTAYVHTLWMKKEGLLDFLSFAAAACLIYFLILLLYRKSKITKRAFTATLCAVVIVESIFSSGVFFGFAGNDISYNQDILELKDKIPDKDEYRVKTDAKRFDVNIVGTLGYGSLSHYTSFTNEDYHAFVKNSGYSSYWMEVSSVGGTKFSDFILGNRYTIVQRGEAGDNAAAVCDNFAIVPNYGNESLAYILSEKDESKIGVLPDTERILKQNEWFRAVSGFSQDLISEISPTNSGNVISNNDTIENISNINDLYTGLINYKVEVKGKKTLYFDCFNEISTKLREVINGSCNVFVNSQKVASLYPSQNSNGILNLGTFENETVSIDIEVLKSINAKSFGLYIFDDELFEKYVRSTKRCEVIAKNNTLKISAFADEAGELLLISVPFSKGFKAKVNGKKAEVIRVFDDLTAVKLESGQNEVTLTSVPRGFFAGAVITAVSVILLVLLFVLKKKKGFSLLKISFKFSRLTAMLFFLLFFAVIIIIYILPFIISFA